MDKEPRTKPYRGLLLSAVSLGLIAALAVLPVQFRSTAAVDEPKSLLSENPSFELENYDIRADKSAEQTRAAFRSQAGITKSAVGTQQQEMLQAQKDLQKRIPGLKVQFNENTFTPEVISINNDAAAEGDFLTGETRVKRSAVLRNFLKQNNELVGVTDQTLNELKVAADYTNPAGNLSFAHLEQFIQGVPVFGGEVKAGFTKKGEMFRVINYLAPEANAASLNQNFGDPADAVRKAFKYINLEATLPSLEVNFAASQENKVVFGTGDFAPTAEKFYFPLEAGTVRSAWRVLIMGDTASYYVVVDAETGIMLWRKNLVEHQTQPATYNVYANTTSLLKSLDNPAPLTPGPDNPTLGQQAPLQSRTSISLIGNEEAEGFNNTGWIPDAGLPVRTPANNNITDGNAVEAGIDRATPNGIDPLGHAVGNPERVFSYEYTPGGPDGSGDAPVPTGSQTYPPIAYQQGAVANLFYITNRYHDEMYKLGFTEQARNFQHDNFGRGGQPSDRISAEAQDSSGTNNANFATPADGARGRMQMYIWTPTAPDRDGDLDAEIVIHELTHGLSNRLHGNATGLGTTISRGMGEGWSDFYAHAMLSEPTDPINGIYTVGGYSTLNLRTAAPFSLTGNYYYGIRAFPKAVIAFTGGPNERPHNPLTFADIDPAKINVTDGAYGAAFAPSTGSVHFLGEVWSSTLWECRAKYIQRLGWAEGNRRILQHITDGMKLAPNNPTFLQERDAIIAGAQAGGEAADVEDLWAGFALRGMGVSASNPSGNTVVEAFDVPGGLENGAVYELEPEAAPGKRLDVTDVSTADGATLQIWGDANGANQRFRAVAVGGGLFELVPQHATSKRVDVPGFSEAEGTVINIWEDNDGSNQRWRAITAGNGFFELEPSHATGKRMDVAGAGSNDGTTVHLWSDNNTPAQRWRLLKQ